MIEMFPQPAFKQHMLFQIEAVIPQLLPKVVDDAGEIAVQRLEVGDLEVVDMLRASRRLAREGQPLLVAEDVECAGLARVRATREGDLGHGRRRQIAQMIDGREEAGLMK